MKLSRKAIRRAAFISDHPTCYFCGKPATTMDHVPHRDYFENRIWPEGYVFPACARCNREGSLSEQTAVMYLRLMDFAKEHPKEELHRVFAATLNNNREALPILMTANETRRAIRDMNLERTGGFLADEPLLRIPPEAHESFEKFSRRLTCALYYKHFQKPVPDTHYIRTFYIQVKAPAAQIIVAALLPTMTTIPNIVRGKKSLEDQFDYRASVQFDARKFAFIAKFSESVLIVGIAWPESDFDKSEKDSAQYIQHKYDF